MKEIFLTKGIGNERELDGYIDEKVAEIKAVPKGEPFRMLITSYGGDTAQGDRIDRAVREHDGETEAMIIGAAASMAMNILPAFDKRYSDPDADLMIHKARYIDPTTGEPIPFDALSSDQQRTINRNSTKMFSRYSAIGVNEEFLEEVYLSDNMDDHYLTTAEAEQLGILEVKPIESESELSLAASHENYKLTSEQTQTMGLFDKKKKPVMQIAHLDNGGVVAFTAVEDKIEEGVKLSAVGTDEPLGKSIVLKGGLKASLNAEGEVVAMEEMEEPKAVVSDEAFAALVTRVEDMEAAVMAMQEAMGASEEADEEAEAKAKEEAEAKAEEDMKDKQALAAIATELKEAASAISSDAKLSKVEDKQEPSFSGMTAKQEQMERLNSIAHGGQKLL